MASASAPVSVVIEASSAAPAPGPALERIIACCLGQSLPPAEIILADAGAAPVSLPLDLAGRVRVVHRPGAGRAAIRNEAAALATSAWLAFPGAEDWWLPGKLAGQAPLLDGAAALVHARTNAALASPPALRASALIRRAIFAARGGFAESDASGAALWTRAVTDGVPAALCDALLAYAETGAPNIAPGAGPAAEAASLFAPAPPAAIPTPDGRPALMVVIDAEEEFDWSTVPARTMGVQAMAHQHRAQRIFARHGLVPTYAIDYMIASDDTALQPLRDFLRDGVCEIGSQLHTWVNPPFAEAMERSNSYAGNLPPWLEFEKIGVLTRIIEDRLGVRPILYRGGRYGAGDYTARLLRHFGYQVDCSVLPTYDLRGDGGPDYRAAATVPYWCGPDRALLEIPVTVGMSGLLAGMGERIYPTLNTPAMQRWRVPSAMRTLRLLDRNRLTPEGTSLAELRRLANDLVHRHGRTILAFSYHSPSLQPGNTPYVRSPADLDRFLATMDGFLDFFFRDLGGIATTPAEVHGWAQAARGTPPVPCSI